MKIDVPHDKDCTKELPLCSNSIGKPEEKNCKEVYEKTVPMVQAERVCHFYCIMLSSVHVPMQISPLSVLGIGGVKNLSTQYVEIQNDHWKKTIS